MERYNKKVIYHYEEVINDEEFEVVVLEDNKVCRDGQLYYNVHVLSKSQKLDENRTLVSLENQKSFIPNDVYFSEKYMKSRLMEHILWDKDFEYPKEHVNYGLPKVFQDKGVDYASL